MPQAYSPAPEVKEVADDLITAHHPHLSTVRIEYIFAREMIKERGKEVWGRARKVSGLNAWLAARDQGYDLSSPEDFFVMEIVKPIWTQLSDKEKKTLTDHELCHFDVDTDTGKLSINPHSLEEFTEIVRRYGLWRPDVEFFVNAAKERPLFAERAAG